MKIRNANPDEAEQLTKLALRSKAHWGYDDSFMRECKPALTIDSQDIASDSNLFEVCNVDNTIVGFYGIELKGKNSELEYLFVEPQAMGRGIGKALIIHAIKAAKSRGVESLEILSDPDAKAFYLTCGAEFIEMRDSDAIEGRQLPFLTLDVSDSTKVTT